MNKLFLEYKTALLPVIDTIFAERKTQYSDVNPWGNDAIKKLNTFVKQGKFLRSGLVLLGAEMFGKTKNIDILHTATALEIMHSSILIHDDIMDKDSTRRHQKSIHKQYEQQISLIPNAPAEHTGRSLGVCLGDLGFFIAWEILTTIEHPNKKHITQRIAREMSLVGIAQMQDVTPFDKNFLDEKKILHMYQYKTGRYTIALPLIVGALLSGYTGKALKDLEEFGVNLGILYQLADDRLNIFGNVNETNRTIGSDIREGKNTLYRALLYRYCSVEEKQKLSHIFGNANITSADIAYVKLLIHEYAIETHIDKIANKYTLSAETCITRLPINDRYKKVLEELLIHMQKRNQ